MRAGRGFLSENESRMYDIQTLKEMRKRLVENLAKFAKMFTTKSYHCQFNFQKFKNASLGVVYTVAKIAFN